jgi:hypothetical protein
MENDQEIQSLARRPDRRLTSFAGGVAGPPEPLRQSAAMVDPIAVRVALLREQLSGLTLRPGLSVVARVLEHQAGRGMLSLAGAVVSAELPENVGEGDRLRLQVQETGPERVVLRLLADAPPAAISLPLPGEPRLRVDEDDHRDDGHGGGGTGESIALVYETARLGALGLRLELHAGAVRAVVAARAGEPHALASAAAGELEQALGRVTGRPAQVRVEERREPLDVYA